MKLAQRLFGNPARALGECGAFLEVRHQRVNAGKRLFIGDAGHGRAGAEQRGQERLQRNAAVVVASCCLGASEAGKLSSISTPFGSLKNIWCKPSVGTVRSK